jgi:hypothetical protein
MAATRPSVVVADAGSLIHLDELNALDVLSDYAVVFVPNAVWLEVLYHRPQALQRENVNLIRQLRPTSSARINAGYCLF